MAVPFSNTKLRVPKGFQNLLEGLAREVLRSQPDQLYEFAAQHFESLLKQRQESGVDPAEHGAKMEDRFYNNKAFTEPEFDPSNPQQQDAALAIQTKFRQHAARQEVDLIREEKAATKIQAGFRGYQGRQRVKSIRNPAETEKEGKDEEQQHAEEEEVDIDLTDPDVEQAAIKIQAGFKGFKARKEMEESKVKFNPHPISAPKPAPSSAPSPGRTSQRVTPPPTSPPKSPSHEQPERSQEETVDIDLDDPDVQKATIKIQAGFRGMKTRSDVKTTQENQSDEDVVEKKQQSPETVGAAEGQAETKPQEPCPSEEIKQQHTEEKNELSADKADQGDDPSTGEEIDIDLEDPEVELAAIKIQAGFKGMKARKELQSKQTVTTAEQQVEEKSPVSPPAEKRVKEVEDEEVDIDLTDPDVEQAAIKIQAGFKGMKTRKEMQTRRDEVQEAKIETESENKVYPSQQSGLEREIETNEEVLEPQEEEIDIDLEDPEVEKAAVKIQAGFKGLKTRRDMAARKSAGSRASAEGTPTTEAEVQPSSTEAPDDAKAAAEEKTAAEPEKPAEAEAANKEQEATVEAEPAATVEATDALSEQPPTETMEEPAKEENADTTQEPANVNSEKAPADTTEQSLAETTQQTPAEVTEQTPEATTDPVPAETKEQVPTETTGQAPADTDQPPADTDQPPAETTTTTTTEPAIEQTAEAEATPATNEESAEPAPEGAGE